MTEKESVKNHFNTIAKQYDYWKNKNSYYYYLLKEFYKENIPVGLSVAEFGCATGDILSSCAPARGLGIDVSTEMIDLARLKHPQFQFEVADAAEFQCDEKFAFVIICDLLDHVSDIPGVIENVYSALLPKGRIICTTLNPLWNPLMTISEKLGLKMPEGPHSFIPNRFIELFCRVKGFEIISKEPLVFIPKKIPFISDILNKIAPKIPFLNRFCWVQVLIAEKSQKPKNELKCSVVIPAYNEEGNIEECVRRVSALKKAIEIIVINDASTDKTLSILNEFKKQVPDLRISSFLQNKGKAQAVEEGIKLAKGEVIVIFDADMAVAPESIPLFIEPLERGISDFVNGTRLVYDMKKSAMSQTRRIGNFIFALFLSGILKLNITDTLCGTKSFFKKDFIDVEFSGERWGDFVLLGGARRKGLRIIEVPVSYYARKAGQSKMRILRDGLKFIVYILKIAFKK